MHFWFFKGVRYTNFILFIICRYKKYAAETTYFSGKTLEKKGTESCKTHFIGTGYNTSPTPGSGIVAIVVLRSPSGFALICFDDIV